MKNNLNKNQLNDLKRQFNNSVASGTTAIAPKALSYDRESLNNLRNQTSKHIKALEWNIKPGQLVIVKDDPNNTQGFRMIARVLGTNENYSLTEGDILTVVDKEILKYRQGYNVAAQQNEFIICFGCNSYLMVHPSVLQVIA